MIDCQICIADDLIELYSQDEKQKNIICIFKKCYTEFINDRFEKFVSLKKK